MRDSYALVLSGGGAKGVYHVGVWKALKEIGVEVDAFVGSSAGAVAAAFLAQGLDDALEDLAGKIGLDWVLNIPEGLVRDGELKVNRGNRKSFRRFYRSVIARGGLDTSPLRRLLEEYIDEDEIRERGKDLGIVAYSITEMRPAEVFIDEMERGRLVDYILASSAFPGFHQPRIGGRRYMDGGIFENIPFAMARRRGCKNIIVSDIGGMGVNRRPNNSHIRGTRTVYIRASLDMGGVLDFNRDFLRRFSRLGYLDTMRTFGCLHGRRYFIRPDGDEEKRFDAFLERPEIKGRLRRALGNAGGGGRGRYGRGGFGEPPLSQIREALSAAAGDVRGLRGPGAVPGGGEGLELRGNPRRDDEAGRGDTPAGEPARCALAAPEAAVNSKKEGRKAAAGQSVFLLSACGAGFEGPGKGPALPAAGRGVPRAAFGGLLSGNSGGLR